MGAVRSHCNQLQSHKRSSQRLCRLYSIQRTITSTARGEARRRVPLTKALSHHRALNRAGKEWASTACGLYFLLLLAVPPPCAQDRRGFIHCPPLAHHRRKLRQTPKDRYRRTEKVDSAAAEELPGQQWPREGLPCVVVL